MFDFFSGQAELAALFPARLQTGQSEFRALSRKISEAGIVLLKNNGLLPLDPQQYQHIAVIGPLDAFGEDRVMYAMGCVDGGKYVIISGVVEKFFSAERTITMSGGGQ